MFSGHWNMAEPFQILWHNWMFFTGPTSSYSLVHIKDHNQSLWWPFTKKKLNIFKSKLAKNQTMLVRGWKWFLGPSEDLVFNVLKWEMVFPLTYKLLCQIPCILANSSIKENLSLMYRHWGRGSRNDLHTNNNKSSTKMSGLGSDKWFTTGAICGY